jgi:hypothetical protein
VHLNHVLNIKINILYNVYHGASFKACLFYSFLFYLSFNHVVCRNRDSVVRIVTSYGLDD